MNTDIHMSRGGGQSSLKLRDSNIELFRIITMIMIVAHHYVVNSGLTAAEGPIYADPSSWRSLFLLLFGAWGKIGINCFVMITGYYMCTAKITAKKFTKLFFEIIFYRIVVSAIFWSTGYEPFSFIGLLKAIIPIWHIDTGFVSAFILFWLLIPFLSIMVRNMNEKQHIYLLLWCGFTYIFLGTVPVLSVTMNYVSWFCVLFVIASYIRLYPKKLYKNTRAWTLLTVAFVMCSSISVIFLTLLGERINRIISYRLVADCNTFLAVATGVCAFMLFKNLKIEFSRVINTVAASTFGVLLIHAHSDTMRQWLWKDVLDVVGHYNVPFMPFYAIGSVLAVFSICIFIDWLRILLIEGPLFKVWDKHWLNILAIFRCLESKILSIIGINA